jgi:hypothetical protein
LELGEGSHRGTRWGVIDVRQVIAVGLVLVGIFDTAAAAGADAANETTFVGYAYDRKTDGLLYTEFHSERTRADGRVLAATYVSPNGEKIATYRSARRRTSASMRNVRPAPTCRWRMRGSTTW